MSVIVFLHNSTWYELVGIREVWVVTELWVCAVLVACGVSDFDLVTGENFGFLSIVSHVESVEDALETGFKAFDFAGSGDNDEEVVDEVIDENDLRHDGL